MDWYSTVFEVIDMRSFSNLWFWIVLAVVWSSASHWVLGVPFDMVARARRNGGQAEQDLEDLVRINTNRLLFIVDEAGLWLTALGSAFLTGLALTGFVYDVEMAQALFLLGFPLTLVGLLSIVSSRRIQNGEGEGEALWRRLRIHRTLVQFIGMASIFCTALWGMYQNLSAHVLGG
ncbi:component of SufBCD complex [Tropicibacter oceani]|uniref:Component of SufBCD complex n=1 Tax=Tropicibacter oceani TaxID=3058420 RepID=A0ABY8QEL4_9RHOB|nr:component of SufBCD complex [Tropicibacter oceani]WGW02949.1 component of SufBCD complex [Tropicibacter oceani]